MVQINIVYQGDLRCEAQHMPSGSRLYTDAPKDNHGKGESFSPTDLLATALGSCMMTLMGITAQRLHLDLTGATVEVKKEMVVQPIRRIGALQVIVTVTAQVTEEQKQELMAAAMTCPVHQSVHPDIRMPIEFRWL